MISILIYGCEKKEIEILNMMSKDLVARYWDERLNVIVLEESEELDTLEAESLDIAFVDATDANGIDFAKAIRQKYEVCEIAIIADVTVSPVLYLTPSIRAATLFLKPITKATIQEGMEGIFHLLKRESDNEDKYLIIKDREERVRIPYSQISYLEARNKRIYIRVQNKEYSMYGIMDVIQEELPEEFKRCHRSFIVNVNYIQKIRYSKNAIDLLDDIEVPLSRSYKADFKEVVRDEF